MPSFCVLNINSKVCYVCLCLIRLWSLKICFPAVYCTVLCQKRVCAVIAGAHLMPAPTAQCLTRFYQMIYCSAALHRTAALSPLALATTNLYPTSEVSTFIVTNKSFIISFLLLSPTFQPLLTADVIMSLYTTCHYTAQRPTSHSNEMMHLVQFRLMF